MVELADTLDLGSSGAIHAGSSPVTRTITKPLLPAGAKEVFMLIWNNKGKTSKLGL